MTHHCKTRRVFVALMLLTYMLAACVDGVTNQADGGSTTTLQQSLGMSVAGPSVDAPVPQGAYPGVPAIHPSQGLTAPDVPAITEQDVREYISTAYPDATIVEIAFLPANAVEPRFDTAPGEFGGRLLAVVTLHGQFPVKVPPEVPPITSDTLSLIFDAHTGNALMDVYPK